MVVCDGIYYQQWGSDFPYYQTLQCDNIGNLWESLVSNSLATLFMEKSLNSDSPQFHQYQQNNK